MYGLSTKEIADKLNIPEGTVTQRLSVGRKKLKEVTFESELDKGTSIRVKF